MFVLSVDHSCMMDLLLGGKKGEEKKKCILPECTEYDDAQTEQPKLYLVHKICTSPIFQKLSIKYKVAQLNRKKICHCVTVTVTIPSLSGGYCVIRSPPASKHLSCWTTNKELAKAAWLPKCWWQFRTNDVKKPLTTSTVLPPCRGQIKSLVLKCVCML